MPIQKGRKLVEQEIFAEATKKVRVFGIELLDIRFKRINYKSPISHGTGRTRSARQQFADLRACSPVTWDHFRQGLRDLGYVDGRNIVIDYRSAQGDFDHGSWMREITDFGWLVPVGWDERDEYSHRVVVRIIGHARQGRKLPTSR